MIQSQHIHDQNNNYIRHVKVPSQQVEAKRKQTNPPFGGRKFFVEKKSHKIDTPGKFVFTHIKLGKIQYFHSKYWMISNAVYSSLVI